MKALFYLFIIINFSILIYTNPKNISFESSHNFQTLQNDKTIYTITKAKYQKTCYPDTGGVEFELEFTKEGIYNEDIKFIEIVLTQIYTHDNIITDCQLLKNDTTFKCVTFDPPVADGKYYPKSSHYYETENYIIKAFSLDGDYIQFDNHYAEPKYYYVILQHDYKDSIKGNFTIEYITEVTTLLSVFINNKLLTCKKDEKSKFKIICFFDIMQAPPDESAEEGKKIYSGYAQNICYQPEITIILTVLKTGDIPKTVITPYLVEYDKSCRNIDEEDSQFTIRFIRFGECDFPVKGLDVYLVNENDESYSYLSQCSKTYSNIDKFTCLTSNLTNVEPGNYYVKIVDDIDIDYYTIKKYSSNEKCVYSEKRYDEPFDVGYVKYDYIKGDVGEIEITFWDTLVDLPTIKLNNHIVKCRGVEDVLKCQFTEKELPLDPSTPTHSKHYLGEIINVCGLLETNFTVHVYKSTLINITNSQFINDNINNNEVCTNLPENYTFYLEYERIGDYFEKQDFTAYLKNKNNETQKVEAKCIISNEYLIKCTTVSSPGLKNDNGEYIVVVDDIQSIYYKINSFKSENYLNFNKNYSHPMKILYKEKHDYFNSKTGIFVLSFESDLKEKPKIIFDDLDYSSYDFPVNKCNVEDDKYLFCEFTSQEFPKKPYFPLEEVTYEGHIINACGYNESKILVTVYQSKDITTSLIVDSLFKKEGYCFALNDEIVFKLSFDRQGIYENEIIIKNKIKLINQNDYSIYLNTSCKNDNNDNNFTCTIIFNNNKNKNEILEGNYYPYLDKDYVDGFVTIKKFNLSEESKFININNDYIQPLSLFGKENEIEINHDYKNNDVGKIKILYKKSFLFNSFVPYIMINNKRLECDTFLNVLTCEFKQRQLPINPLYGEKERTYKGYLINACGYEEKKVIVNVKKSFTVEKIKININQNVEFSLKKTDVVYKKYFAFKLYISKNGNVNNENHPIKIDNVLLVNKNESKYVIMTKCVYLKNNYYFICKTLNENIMMYGKYFVEMKEKYIDDYVIVYPFKSVNFINFIDTEAQCRGINYI